MKLREMKQLLEEKTKEARGLIDSDIVKAEEIAKEVRELKKKIELQEELEEEERRDLENQRNQKNKEKGNGTMETRSYKNAAKELMQGKTISTREIQINGTTTKPVVPVEFINDLEKLEAGYGSLENECDVISVTSATGKRPVSTFGGKLSKLTAGQKIPEGALDFKEIAYDVQAYGEIIAVDNSLAEDSAIDLFTTIKENFAVKSVNTKNEAILGALEDNKKSADVQLTTDVVGDIIKTIDSYAPSVRRFVKVLANTALRAKIKNSFYEASGKDQRVTVDANGRVFIDSHEVLEFDFTLAKGTPEGYVGPLKGVKFFKRTGVEMAQSDQAYWDSNATAVRVVTRFDVKGLDNNLVKPTKLVATP